MTYRDFILAQLEYANIYVRASEDEALIVCPWHSETKPSLNISLTGKNVVPGAFYCFGCNEHGNWNKLADKLNLKKISGKQANISTDFSILNTRLKKLQNNNNNYELPKNLFVWDGLWRGLTSEFLEQFQPAKYFDNSWLEWRILFPITHFKKLVGHLSERISYSKAPKHLFSKGLPTSKILYPVDLHQGHKAVLVEGLADMLRLRRDGIPALCFFGTGNWKKDKQNILLNLGIEKVIACGDGDRAGWAVNQTIAHDLSYKRRFDVEIFNIPKRSSEVENLSEKELKIYIEKNKLNISSKMKREDILEIIDKKSWDPGNMPCKFVRQLKKLLK